MHAPRGFTLIESLVALSVLSLFASLPLITAPKIQEDLEVYYFLNQFENNILLTQQAAVFSTQRTTIKREYDQPNVIEFLLEEGEKVAQFVPEALTVIHFPRVFFSLATGDIQNQEKVIFSWPKKKQKITYEFLFGKGRYEKKVEPTK